MITLGDVHFCMAEVSIITNDLEPALSHARKSLQIFDKHDRNGWRFAQAQNELSEAYISAGMYEHAIEQADLAIISYSVLEEPEYADWAQMNKGSLCVTLDGMTTHRRSLRIISITESKNLGQWTRSHSSMICRLLLAIHTDE